MNDALRIGCPAGRTLPRRFLTLAALSLLLVGTSGCATLTLATLATAVGIAGSAVTTGNAVFSQGKLDSAEMSTHEKWAWAIEAAARDLGLTSTEKLRERQIDPREFILTDQKKETIRVTFELRSPTLIRNQISVGLFGSEPTARLLLSQIRKRAGVTTSGDELPSR